MPFAHRDGTELYWRADGSPELPALVLGNSLGTDQSLWDCVMPQLMQSFYVVRMDMRGHGASVLSAHDSTVDWSIAMFAGDVLAVADAAGIGRFYFAGISIGGMIGLWLGAHACDRVLALLVSNTAARLPADVWAASIEAVREGGMQALVDDTLARWFTPGYVTRGDPVLATIRQNFLRVDPAGYAGVGAVLRDIDLRALLSRVAVPTRVVTGREDRSTPPALGQAIATAVVDAVYVELPAAHIPPPELPRQFAAEIRLLLKHGPDGLPSGLSV